MDGAAQRKHVMAGLLIQELYRVGRLESGWAKLQHLTETAKIWPRHSVAIRSVAKTVYPVSASSNIRVNHMFLRFCNLTWLSCYRFRNSQCGWSKVSSCQCNLLATHQPLISRDMESSKLQLRRCLLDEFQLRYTSAEAHGNLRACFWSECTLCT